SSDTGVFGTTDGSVTKVLLGSATFTYQGIDSAFTLSSFSSLTNGSTTLFDKTGLGAKTIGLDFDNDGKNTGYTGPAYKGAVDSPFSLLLTSTSVPEPNSMILTSLAAISGSVGCIRRRFAQKLKAAAAPSFTHFAPYHS